MMNQKIFHRCETVSTIHNMENYLVWFITYQKGEESIS